MVSTRAAISPGEAVRVVQPGPAPSNTRCYQPRKRRKAADELTKLKQFNCSEIKYPALVYQQLSIVLQTGS